MPSLPVRVLTVRELRKLRGWRRVKRHILREIAEAQAAVVPPRGDGDVHDCAAALIVGIVRRRPWRRGNHGAALTGAAVLYRLNCFYLTDADALVALLDAVDSGTISDGALCEGLVQIVEPAAPYVSRSRACGQP